MRHIYWVGIGKSKANIFSLCGSGVAIMVNKRVQNAVLGCNLKNNRMISVRFQGKPFNIIIQEFANFQIFGKFPNFFVIISTSLPFQPENIL